MALTSIDYTNNDTFSSTFALGRRGKQTIEPLTMDDIDSKTTSETFFNKTGIVLEIIAIAALIFSSFSLLFFGAPALLISSACLISTARELFFTKNP